MNECCKDISGNDISIIPEKVLENILVDMVGKVGFINIKDINMGIKWKYKAGQFTYLIKTDPPEILHIFTDYKFGKNEFILDYDYLEKLDKLKEKLEANNVLLLFLLRYNNRYDLGDLYTVGKNGFIFVPYYISLKMLYRKGKRNSSLDIIAFRNGIIRTISIPFSELRPGLPFGRTADNSLNELDSKEWIKFTKTWFIINPPPRDVISIIHPAKFPEDLVARFIRFFSKRGQIIFDPFLGVGSTAVTALELGRKVIGIEINPKYHEIAVNRCQRYASVRKITDFMGVGKEKSGANEVTRDFKNHKILPRNRRYMLFNEDSRNIDKIWRKFNLPKVDFCITSPPYWDQLKIVGLRQKDRVVLGYDTDYGNDKSNLGNIHDYKEFLEEQNNIFKKVYDITEPGKYLVIITNNIFKNGRVYPLAFHTMIRVSEIGWIPLDEQIWCQDNKALKPLGLFKKYLGNRCHQYCLIFQKPA